MEDTPISVEEHIKYWVDGAEKDFPVAKSLMEKGHYEWALFIGHLVLEKVLKALFVQKNRRVPPKIHNLLAPAKGAGLELPEESLEFLDKVNFFQHLTRYPDIRRAYAHQIDAAYATDFLARIEEMSQCLKARLK